MLAGEGAGAVQTYIKLVEGLNFYLANTFTRETDVLADLFERQRLIAVEPVAEPKDRGLAVIDGVEQDADGLQIIVDREKGQYLGHPTTVLLEDGRTMIAVYPKGHGKGAIIMKRSDDAGLTWSRRLPTPANWASSKEVPTIHRVIDAKGTRRLILFSGLHPIRMAVSEDDGRSWSALQPIGDFGGIVTMGCVERLRNGDHMALFHDDGRFLRRAGRAEAQPLLPTRVLFGVG